MKKSPATPAITQTSPKDPEMYLLVQNKNEQTNKRTKNKNKE